MSPASLFILFNISSSRSSVGIFDGSKHKPLYSPGFVSVSVKVIPLIEFAVWFSKFIFHVDVAIPTKNIEATQR